MKKLKKLFLEENMSWKKLIIFSLISGIITGIIALLKPLSDTSIHNVAVCYEMWILLAIFIILKSKKPLEAGIKTFVFFLISQPLCYLVQVPFYINGFDIFIFYKFWFIMTLLTFPGGIIAWYIKKQNVWSMIILSIANLMLITELYTHLNTLIQSFPHQLLAVIFIIFEIIFLINIIFEKKSKRIILYFITSILIPIIFISIYKFDNNNKQNLYHIGIAELDESTYELIEKDSNIEVEINDYTIIARSKNEGDFFIKLINSEKQLVEIIFHVTDQESTLEMVTK